MLTIFFIKDYFFVAKVGMCVIIHPVMENLEPKKTTDLRKAALEEDSKPAATLPSVFDYKSHRSYLKDWFLAKKHLSRGYSTAVFAKKARLSSKNLLGMVIRGERNLSWTSINGFSKALGLKLKEKNYFEKLVLFNQTKNSEDKDSLFEQLRQISKGSQNKILDKIKDYKSYYEHWYIVAIREMVSLEDFEADPSWMAKKLKNKISKKQAAEAWRTLQNIGMVCFNKEKQIYEVVNAALDHQNSNVDFIIRNFHKEYLNLTLNSIDGDIKERELSSLTIAVTDKELEEIKSRINEYRRYLNLLYTKSKKESLTEKPQNLIAVNTQLLNLTSEKTIE